MNNEDPKSAFAQAAGYPVHGEFGSLPAHGRFVLFECKHPDEDGNHYRVGKYDRILRRVRFGVLAVMPDGLLMWWPLPGDNDKMRDGQ